MDIQIQRIQRSLTIAAKITLAAAVLAFSILLVMCLFIKPDAHILTSSSDYAQFIFGLFVIIVGGMLLITGLLYMFDIMASIIDTPISNGRNATAGKRQRAMRSQNREWSRKSV